MKTFLLLLLISLTLLTGCQKPRGENTSGVSTYTYVSGRTFTNKKVFYKEKNGLAIFEGDIVLGTVKEMEEHRNKVESGSSQGSETDAITTNRRFGLWPEGHIYYTIDAGLPNKTRVQNAINHYERESGLLFTERTDQANYITFRRMANTCNSSVGRRGGQQFINLGDDCSTGNTVHEIGHAIGFWHEQSRRDRDDFIVIHWDNISEENKFNFNQQISDSLDLGDYDYVSIMHYGAFAFSKNGEATITKIGGSTSGIGNRSALSPLDLAAIERLYGE